MVCVSEIISESANSTSPRTQLRPKNKKQEKKGKSSPSYTAANERPLPKTLMSVATTELVHHDHIPRREDISWN